MTPSQLIAQAARLEHRAQHVATDSQRLQLRGEALVCRGHAWIQASGDPTVTDWEDFLHDDRRIT